MKKCKIYVFSGTGNTLKIAGYYKEYLAEKYETEIYKVEYPYNNFPDPKDADLIGFGYPLHGFNAPEPLIKLVKNLPAVEGTHTFIFKCGGEGLHANDASSHKLISILKKKNYAVYTDRHYVMPYNMIFRHKDEMVKQMVPYARALCRANVKEIFNGKKEKLCKNPFLILWSAIVRIEWWYARFQGPFMKVDMKKCSKCMLCIKNCPLHNITFTEKNQIKIGSNCALCVCCSFNCPKNAISIGLLNGWKVNGKYDFKGALSNKNFVFPYITEKSTGVYRIYRKYYRECDERLKKEGISITEDDFRP